MKQNLAEGLAFKTWMMLYHFSLSSDISYPSTIRININFFFRFAKNLTSDKINISSLKGEGELSNLELNEDVLTNLLELPTWLRITKAVCNRVAIKVCRECLLDCSLTVNWTFVFKLTVTIFHLKAGVVTVWGGSDTMPAQLVSGCGGDTLFINCNPLVPW